MLLSNINKQLPDLQKSLANLPAVNYIDPLWNMMRRLLLAHAPSSGANLLGGIGDDIAVLADDLGLRERVIAHLGSTGNTGIWLGANKEIVDVIVVAHMDRPSFRVKDVGNGTLYPICANRFPAGDYSAPAKAVRFARGRLVVSAEGMLYSQKSETDENVRFETRRGALDWHDTVMLDINPVSDGDMVIGTGLDNCLGVTMALLTATVLFASEAVLREREKRCLFVFTDQEEGNPASFFGHGAARLSYALRPPTYGCIVVDAQNAEQPPDLDRGVCHATASRWGQGSVVPPNYQALAHDLAGELNGIRPGTVQMNNGYVSRSDDVALGRWARILALTGPPMTGAHTAQEIAHLSDIQNGVWWLAHYLAVTLNLVPALTPHYALGQ